MRQVTWVFAAGIAMWLWTAAPATAQQGTGELRGTLRVAVSVNFGVREVIPRLPASCSVIRRCTSIS